MIVIEEPPAAPVALAQVKAFLRIGHDGEDDLLESLIRVAGEICERFTRLALMRCAVLETLPALNTWQRLGLAPVWSITGVEALDAQGAGEELSVDGYAIDIDSAGEGWVRVTRWGAFKRIRVTYEAGLAAEAEALPEALRHGIVRLIAHLYAHRDREEGAGPPAAVTALWRPWRRLRLK